MILSVPYPHLPRHLSIIQRSHQKKAQGWTYIVRTQLPSHALGTARQTPAVTLLFVPLISTYSLHHLAMWTALPPTYIEKAISALRVGDAMAIAVTLVKLRHILGWHADGQCCKGSNGEESKETHVCTDEG